VLIGFTKRIIKTIHKTDY